MCSGKDIKSKKYVGVVYRVLRDKSKTFYIIYKHPIEKRTIRTKIGSSKEGMNEAYCNNIRLEEIAKARLGEDSNLPIVRAKQNKTNLDDLANNYIEYLSTKGNNKTTTQAKSRYERYLKSTVGELQLSQLNKTHHKKMQDNLVATNLSPTTINHILTLLSTIINYNIKNDLIKGVNPLIGVKCLKTNDKRDRYLEVEELNKLFKHTKKDDTLHLFTLLALSTGARLNGLLSIKVKDVDLLKKKITINDFKSGGTYQGFIKDDMIELLIRAMEGFNSDDYVISYDNGSKCNDKMIQRRLQPILNKLFNQEVENGLSKVVIHTLRHTFASLLAINDVSIYKIMKLMNHKDITMTMRYAKLSPSSGQEDINNLF